MSSVGLSDIPRTTSFRLALLFLGLFGTASLGVFGFLYWQTAGYLASGVDDWLGRETDRSQRRTLQRAASTARRAYIARSGGPTSVRAVRFPRELGWRQPRDIAAAAATDGSAVRLHAAAGRPTGAVSRHGRHRLSSAKPY